MARTSNPDWGKIKNEYISTDISQRRLAKKYGVSVSMLMKISAKEKWGQQREANSEAVREAVEAKKAAIRDEINDKVTMGLVEASAEKEIDRLMRIRTASDRLLEQLETAIEQLDHYVVVEKTKRKDKKSKIAKDGSKTEIESVTETDVHRVEKGDIDRAGLRQLTAALKDLIEINANALGQSDDGETGVILLSPVVEEDE